MKNLISPTIDSCAALHPLSQCAICEELGGEANRARVLVEPPVVERHDVLVLQSLQDSNFREDAVPLVFARPLEFVDDHLVPGDLRGDGGEEGAFAVASFWSHLDAELLVKGLVHALLRALADQLPLCWREKGHSHARNVSPRMHAPSPWCIC